MDEYQRNDAPTFAIAEIDNRARAAPSGKITHLKAPNSQEVLVLDPPKFMASHEYAAMGRQLITLAPPPIIVAPMEGTHVPAMAECAQAGEVFEHNHGLYYKCSDRKSFRVSNFVVRLIRRIVKHSPYGAEIWLELELVSQRRSRNYMILASQFLKLASKLAEDFPEFRLYPDSGKAHAHFRVYLSRLMEDFGETLEEQHIYTYPGWQCEQGRWHYYSGIDEGCESSVKLVDLTRISMNDQQAADAFVWHALDMGDPFVLVPFIIHIHSGALHRPFAEAGLPIRFIFDLQGQTSIGKTMLMEMFCFQFDEKRRMANFQSTGKGVENFAEEEHHDGLLVIDDLSSAQDKKGKELLERILRGCCNGSGRIVASKGGKGYEIADASFTVMMTSEGKADGLRQSAQYRIFTVPMTKESLINRQVVEEYKNILLKPRPGQISPVDVHMTRFIRWMEGNFDVIVRDIATFQLEMSAFQTPRHEAMFRVLAAEARVVLRFFVYAGILRFEDAEIFAQQWIQILSELIRYNEELGQESDPVRTFLEILVPGIRQELVLVAQTRAEFELNPAVFYGFWAESVNGMRLVLDPMRLFQWSQRQFAALHRAFPSTLDEILRKLVGQDLSEGYARKDRKNPKPLKSFKINGASLNMLVLRWEAVEVFLSKKGEQNEC